MCISKAMEGRPLRKSYWGHISKKTKSNQNKEIKGKSDEIKEKERDELRKQEDDAVLIKNDVKEMGNVVQRNDLSPHLNVENVDTMEFDCLLCGELFSTTHLYVLERCGHFFCVKCLYSYAKQQLQLFRQSFSSLPTSQINDRKYFEIFCPLGMVCGINISASDLRVGFKTFCHEVFENELVSDKY
jgi:hypothetical protein